MRIQGSITNATTGEVVVTAAKLVIERGKILLVTGKSGSGKSLLARALCGLLPDSLVADAGLEIEGAVYVGEDPDTQIATLSVEDEAASALEFALVPREEITLRVNTALEEVGLSGLGSRNPWELSGGQRQRLAIACALVRNPRVLVLDNPFGNIDVAGRAHIKALLRRLAQRGCAVVVFQSGGDASWADHVCELCPVKVLQADQAALNRFVEAARHTGFRPLAEVEVEGLVLGPDGARLNGVSLSLASGEVNVLRGDNGCGKTSLIAAIAGAAKPSSGRFVCQGVAYKRLPAGLVAWVQQNPERHFTQPSVEQEIKLALSDAEPEGPLPHDAIEALPSAFGFALDDQTTPFALSAGGKRRLSLLLGFLQNRPILLLDEPFAGLDDPTVLTAAIDAFARAGGCVLMSSHEDEVPEGYRILPMHAGQIAEGRDLEKGAVRGEGAVARIEGSAATSDSRVPSCESHDPVLNPLATLASAILLVVFGVTCAANSLVFVAAFACVAGVAIASKSVRRAFSALAAAAIAAAVFGLMALRGNAGDAFSLQAVTHHATIGAVFLSSSILASSLFTVPQLFDAAAQVLRVPYTWCTLAIGGFSIGMYLRSASSLIAAALRLRTARAGRTFHNVAAGMFLPPKTALPLFVEAIRYAQRLSVTLASRGFGSRSTKTFRGQYPWRVRDTAVVALFSLLVVAGIIL